MAKEAQRIHEIDGLRSVAILLVLFHHTFSHPIIRELCGGEYCTAGAFLYHFSSSGVQLFFVLSGYVLFLPYFRYNKDFQIFKYFRRRFARLFPPYLVVLLINSLFVLTVNHFPNHLAEPYFAAIKWEHVIKKLFIFNFDTPFFNPVLWSLEIEMIFYLILPLLYYLFRLLRIIRWLWIPITLVVGGVSLWISMQQGTHTSGYFGALLSRFLYYFPCFWTGALIAARPANQKTGFAFLGTGLVYVLFSLWYAPHNVAGAYWLVYAGILIVATQSSGTGLNRLLASRAMVWLGERSYSMFLGHYPALNMANYAAGFVVLSKGLSYFALTRSLGLIAALIFTIFVFQAVERHFARNLQTGHLLWPWSKTKAP